MKKLLFMGMLSLLLLLSGCAAGIMGGGHHSNNNPTQQQRSIEQVKADGAISSAVKARFAKDALLNKLKVSTYRGVVTLYGNVPTHNVMDRAISLAGSVNGVTRVRSGLELR